MADLTEKIQALFDFATELFTAIKDFVAGWEKHFAFEDQY